MRTTPRSSPASVERVFASAGAAFASRAGVLHGKMSSLDYLDLCRLCLVKDRVSVPIFEGEGDVRQIFLKITACLPVKVDREDKLPKKICDDCVYKVELFYQFWNTSVNAEKQLLQWLGEVGLEEKPDYVTNVLNQNVMKADSNGGNRLDGNMMQQVSGHQNNMGMGMMDNISLSMPMMMSTTDQQQITSVPMDTSGSSVQELPGTSTQSAHEQITQSQTNTSNQHEEEEESSEEEENSEDECDGEEGLPVKEESEEDPNNSRVIEPTTFVNVSLACDEAGPSGLQQQKVTEMPEMAMPQNTDGDPKSGNTSNQIDNSRLKNTKLLQSYIPIRIDTSQRMKSEKTCKGKKSKDISYDVYIITLKDKSPLKDYSAVLEEHNYNLPQTMETSNVTDKITENQKALTCTISDFSCKKKSTMITHPTEKRDRIGRTSEDRNCKKKGEFICDVCGLAYAKKETLNSHFVRKHTQHYCYFCKYCGKKFQTESDLTTHTRLVHEGSPVKCNICKKTFKNSHSLYIHQKHTHYSAKFECPMCHKRLVTKENLDHHILTRHEKKEKCICEKCGKTFVTSYYLRKHMRIHTGDKPYICNICNKAFTTHNSHSQHILLHTGERIYPCDICGKMFAQKAGLMCHRKHHPGILPPLPIMHVDHIVKEILEEMKNQ